MRLNKLEVIQGLSKIKQLKLPHIKKGDIVNWTLITLLISYLLHNVMVIIDEDKELTGEELLIINNHFLIVKKLFELMDDGFMMKREFNQIKKDFKIKFDK